MSSVVLTAENERFIETQVANGRYASIADAVNALITQQRSQSTRLHDRVEQAMAEIERGEYQDFDVDELRVIFDELIESTAGDSNQGCRAP